MSAAVEGRSARATHLRHAAKAARLAPAATAAARFLHLTLPAGTVRYLDSCPLRPDAIATLRETVLPKLARGSAVLPARPRFRLITSLSAPGGRLFEVRARHGAGLVVARIGIGWRDHGANLVWAACGPRAEPKRPWLVDALDAAGLSMLKADEAARLERWVPSLAGDLAMAATPPDAFADGVLWADDEHPWEVRETRELGTRTLDMREPDIAGGLLLRPATPTDPHENPTTSSEVSPPNGAGGEENQAARLRLVGTSTRTGDDQTASIRRLDSDGPTADFVDTLETPPDNTMPHTPLWNRMVRRPRGSAGHRAPRPMPQRRILLQRRKRARTTLRLTGAVAVGFAGGTAVALFLHGGGGLLVEVLAGLALFGAAGGLVCGLTFAQQQAIERLARRLEWR